MFDSETFEFMTHIGSCILAAAIIFKEFSFEKMDDKQNSKILLK